MTTLLRGGLVITDSETFLADVLVEDGVIAAIEQSLDASADKIIDAAGMYVLPGCIDPHTHLDSPGFGTSTCDDFTSGTIAAACGGTTTIVDFCLQSRGQSPLEALEMWHTKLERHPPVVDVGFHLGICDLTLPGAFNELKIAADRGVTSFKLFMAYKGALMVDDATLFKTMQVAAEIGALVMVHAENGDVIDVLVKQALADGKTEPRYHALTRPPEIEGEATNRAIQLARVAGSPLYVVHVSCREAIEPIQLARAKGWDVHAETCTQYFFIDQTFLDRPYFEAARYLYSTPPRPRENQEHLWNAVRNDVLSVISTDHSPYYKFPDKTIVKRDDFSKIPNGAPGIEERLRMIHHFGVRQGRISLTRMVELLCTNPAKLFGLYPRKGTIAVGSDADIVIFDPEESFTISASQQHSRIDYSLFEGVTVKGSPAFVLSHGKILVEDGCFVGSVGDGSFIPRGRWNQARPPIQSDVISIPRT